MDTKTSRKHRGKQKLYRLLFVVVATVVSLGALELAARIVFSRSGKIEAGHQSTRDELHVTDEDVIYHMRPDYDGYFSHVEYNIHIT